MPDWNTFNPAELDGIEKLAYFVCHKDAVLAVVHEASSLQTSSFIYETFQGAEGGTGQWSSGETFSLWNETVRYRTNNKFVSGFHVDELRVWLVLG